jgi:hypothetical protein
MKAFDRAASSTSGQQMMQGADEIGGTLEQKPGRMLRMQLTVAAQNTRQAASARKSFCTHYTQPKSLILTA